MADGHNIAARKTPADVAYENADAARTEILDEARKDAESFVRHWLLKMERLQPDYVHPIRSEDSAIEWVEEAILSLMNMPRPDDAAFDERQKDVEDME